MEINSPDVKEKARLFGKKYKLSELQEIVMTDNNPDIEYLDEDLEYICDNSTVEFFRDYRLSFRRRKTGDIAYLYIRRYNDRIEILDVFHIQKRKAEKRNR